MKVIGKILVLMMAMYMANLLAGVLDDLPNQPTCNPAISSCTPGTVAVACKETACLITQATKDKFEKDNKCKFTECSDEITEVPLSVLKQVFNGSPAILVAMAEELTYSLKLSATKTLVNTKRKLAHFLAQVKQEIGDNGDLTENLNYQGIVLRHKFSYFKKEEHKCEAYKYGSNTKIPKDKIMAEQMKVEMKACEALEHSNSYPEEIANRAYSNEGNKSLGNGSIASGEGWKYRGRGLIQLTGKSNYEEFNKDQKEIWDKDDVDFVQNPEKALEDKYAVRSALWFWKKHHLEINAAKGLTKSESYAITKVVNKNTESYDDRFENLTKIIKIDFFKECQ